MARSREAPLNLISASLVLLQRYVDRLKENLSEQTAATEAAAGPDPDAPGPNPLISAPEPPASGPVPGPVPVPATVPAPAPRPPAPVSLPIPEPIGERHKRRISQDVKIAVSARDGGRCRQCGSTQQLHFDHVIPVSRGGANTVANIQLLCGPCNRAKAAKMIRRTAS
jgi:hypothetical protein